MTPDLATSRYQAHDLIVESGLVPVRTTRGAPRFKLGYPLTARLVALTPSRQTFAIRQEAAFEASYRAQLEAVGVEELTSIMAALSQEYGGRGLVLLCFEDVHKLGEGSCHRRSFARWWEKRTGQVVPELGTKES